MDEQDATMRGDCCATCPCWEHFGRSDVHPKMIGTCRVLPPVMQNSANGHFPQVYADCWCTHHPARQGAYQELVFHVRSTLRGGLQREIAEHEAREQAFIIPDDSTKQ